MKRIMILVVLSICFACEDDRRSHTETAKIVVESFFEKDLPALQKHTTSESFNAFMNIQNTVPQAETGASGFEVLRDTIMDETAWVKFTTAFAEKPETFKLVKENGRWKVTEIGMGEKGPF